MLGRLRDQLRQLVLRHTRVFVFVPFDATNEDCRALRADYEARFPGARVQLIDDIDRRFQP
ncbi:hypothetical protein ABZ215_13610 [Amycolatopsis sp. NPDC006131]|uniref:hypothetical protein n=1 Tax=Amycolatopsis sp. NPDC006131 TaxID=3156731 RepID=UPI0033B2204A